MKYDGQLKSNTTVEHIFHRILSRELKSITKWRKVAIKGEDPEGVHQIRISLRKIRTALVVFKPAINTKYSQLLAKKLKKYATVLDDARDIDVYILTHFTDDTDSTIKFAVIAKRNIAYQHVKKSLKSKSFNKRLRSAKKWLRNGQWRNKIRQDKKLNHSLTSFAFDTLEKLMKVINIKSEQTEQLDNKALHKLRIDCKKLRYTTEFFSSLYDPNSLGSFMHKLKQLQDSLGDIHDAFIQKQLHQKLVQKDEKIQETQASKKILLQIERTSELKKPQLIKELTAFCQTEYPWRT